VRDHSLHSYLPDEFRDVDAPLQSEVNKVEKIMDALDLAREKEGVATLVSAATAAGATENAPEKWDNPAATQDPISYLLGKIAVILSKVGKRPNTIAMDFQVASALYSNKVVRDVAK